MEGQKVFTRYYASYFTDKKDGLAVTRYFASNFTDGMMGVGGCHQTFYLLFYWWKGEGLSQDILKLILLVEE